MSATNVVGNPKRVAGSSPNFAFAACQLLELDTFFLSCNLKLYAT